MDGGYRRMVRGLRTLGRRTRALQHVIGGEFHAFGIVEREMLRFYGLRTGDTLVDVGCGVGRLARALRTEHRGRYVGTDVVPEFVRKARAEAARPDWTFRQVRGFTIPVPGASVDFIACFSVFTHLPHEHTFLYLEEARRALKPGGRIVFSFLEFAAPSHWTVFAVTVEEARTRRPGITNVFIERTAIAAWAAHLGLDVVELRAGDERFVPLPEPVTLDDGSVMADFGCLGQSIAVLEK